MDTIGLCLELLLVGLLALTLRHAFRLQRALNSLRDDRSTLEAAVSGFDSGTRLAEAGLARLRDAADQLAAQLQQAGSLRDDLTFLAERGDAVADRLDAMVRSARALDVPTVADAPLRYGPAQEHPTPPSAYRPAPVASKLRSQAERSLLTALQARQ